MFKSNILYLISYMPQKQMDLISCDDSFRPDGGVVAQMSGVAVVSTASTPTAWAGPVAPRPTPGGSRSRTTGWAAVVGAATTEVSARARRRAPGTATWTTCPSGRPRTIQVWKEAAVLMPMASLRPAAAAEGLYPAGKNQDMRVSEENTHTQCK